MKISEVIAKLDSLKPNAFAMEDKIGWINELEWRIKKEIVDTHEIVEPVDFDGYSGEESLEQVVIAQAPWDNVYLRWLECMVDYYNGESARLANSRILFNDSYADFAAWYNRTHRPLSTRMKYY